MECGNDCVMRDRARIQNSIWHIHYILQQYVVLELTALTSEASNQILT